MASWAGLGIIAGLIFQRISSNALVPLILIILCTIAIRLIFLSKRVTNNLGTDPHQKPDFSAAFLLPVGGMMLALSIFGFCLGIYMS